MALLVSDASFGRKMTFILIVCLMAPGLLPGTAAYSQSVGATGLPATVGDDFTVEYYYKVRWGAQKEFWRLFQKNHLPLLQRQLDRGEIKALRMETPHFHQPDVSRWDYRVTVVYPNAAAAVRSFTEEEKRLLYPDQATFTQEEQRRFELLIDHWDLPVTAAPLKD